MHKDLTIIGRVEHVVFPDLHQIKVPVKIDTGADACSIWAHAAETEQGRLQVVFFGEGSPYHSGNEHIFMPNDFSITRVSNSFGVKQLRYKVKLRIRIKERLIKGTFTLSDRSTKLYPVLIGRSLLRSKFLVDVTKGTPLRNEERARATDLGKELEVLKGNKRI